MNIEKPDVSIFSASRVIEMEQLHLKVFAVLWSLLWWWPLLRVVKGHAIFWEPPSRASLGKHNLNFCKVPVNDDHMSLYCGGIKVS